MMTKFSLRPVEAVIDVPSFTSAVFFNPSGVISKAQAKISTNGNPMAISTITVLITQPGVPKASNRTSAICTTTHAKTM